MNRNRVFLAAFLLFACSALHAQAAAGATGQCKDGTYSTAKSKSGACSGHKGVQSWYAAAATPSAPASSVAPAPAPSPAPAKAAAPTRSSPAPLPAQAAAGGGPGQVWVNTSTKVYHCGGDRYYGKTKNGAYMSESDAVAKGARPDAGKSCTK